MGVSGRAPSVFLHLLGEALDYSRVIVDVHVRHILWRLSEIVFGFKNALHLGLLGLLTPKHLVELEIIAKTISSV